MSTRAAVFYYPHAATYDISTAGMAPDPMTVHFTSLVAPFLAAPETPLARRTNTVCQHRSPHNQYLQRDGVDRAPSHCRRERADRYRAQPGQFTAKMAEFTGVCRRSMVDRRVGDLSKTMRCRLCWDEWLDKMRNSMFPMKVINMMTG